LRQGENARSRRSNLMERAASTLTNCGTGLSSTAQSRLTSWSHIHCSQRRTSFGQGVGRADKLRGDASQRVRRVLKKDPTLSMTRLSEKANVSQEYASHVRAHVLNEHQHNPFPGR
jgi:hypothetical protein